MSVAITSSITPPTFPKNPAPSHTTLRLHLPPRFSESPSHHENSHSISLFTTLRRSLPEPRRSRRRRAMPTPASFAKLGGVKRTVLITGVSRGLGRALALEMARRGHYVIGIARSQDKLDSLQHELAACTSSASSSSSPSAERQHLIFNVDVRSNSDVEQLAKTLVENKRIPDIIVNNAGTINKNNKMWEVPAEEFDTVLDTNVKGIANVLRHFIPLMIRRNQGIIINASSGWGRSVAAQVAPYCASKWAVEGLTRSVAKELIGGVAVVALSPGVVHTEMLESCFGGSASNYTTPDEWAPRAATMMLNLTAADNGASLTV